MQPFTEIQTYPHIYPVIAFSLVLVVCAVLWKYVPRKLYLFLFALLFIPLVGYMSLQKMYTRIDAQGVHYRMWPAQTTERTITWSNVYELSVKNNIQYRKYRRSDHELYAVNDKYGLYIKLRDGSNVILGTKDPRAMETAIWQARYGQVQVRR